MTQTKPEKAETDHDHNDTQTDEEWVAAIEKDVQERFGEILKNAHWVDVGEPGW